MKKCFTTKRYPSRKNSEIVCTVSSSQTNLFLRLLRNKALILYVYHVLIFICGIEKISNLNRFAEFSVMAPDPDRKISLVTWVGTFRKNFQFRCGTSTDGTLRGGKNRDFYPFGRHFKGCSRYLPPI